MEDVSTNINLLVSEEIVQEDFPWSGQCRQVGDRIQIVDHHISKSPHLRTEWNYVHGFLGWCTTMNLYHFLNGFQTIIVLHCHRLRRTTNFKEVLC